MVSEKEYIERGALLDKLKELKEEWGFTFTADGVEEAIFAVEEEPAADVVEVVRCKDCKYYKHFKGLGNWCHRRIRSDIEYHTKTTDFCSFGERKE